MDCDTPNQEDPGLSGFSGHFAHGLCSFRTVRRIPDSQNSPSPPGTTIGNLGHH